MIYSLGTRKVKLEATDYFVAPNATVIGSVEIQNEVSIWFNAVIRGDNEWIVLGEGTNVQDGAVLHTDKGIRLEVGRGVTIGHQATVHGCQIGAYSLIGINAVILNRAKIGRYCLIGANSLIPEGKEIPDYSLVMGSPGRVIRTLNEAERLKLEQSAANYIQNFKRYVAELAS